MYERDVATQSNVMVYKQDNMISILLALVQAFESAKQNTKEMQTPSQTTVHAVKGRESLLGAQPHYRLPFLWG